MWPLKVFAESVCVKITFLLFALLASFNGYVESNGLKSPAKEFSKYEIIQLLVYDGRTKREISTTRDSSGLHLSEVEIVVKLKEETLVLELRREEDLVAETDALHYQLPGGAGYQVPRDQKVKWCNYRGHVRHRAGSWCAVSTCHGVKGVVFDGRNVWYIQPADEDSSLKSKHYLYHEKDKNTTHRSFNPGSNNTGLIEIERNRHENHYRYKRNAAESRSEPYGADKHSRYVELVIVADYAMYKLKEGNEQAIHREMVQLVNIVNAMYAPLNIYIILVDVVIWNNGDKIIIDKHGLSSLETFLKYRATKLIKDLRNDHALLISGVKFDHGVVGKSLPSAMCTLASSGSIVHYHTTVQELMAATLAHEMGHSFGMLHDGPECECPDVKCIMDQSSNSLIPVHWSSCSLKSLTLELSKGIDYCLRNKPRQAMYPSCGNGLLEPGEQCDCGKVVEGIDNACVTCCNPETCLLRDHAICAGGACCDLSTCKPKSKGTICRPAEAECELPEYCTGDSGFCPEDVHLMDTTPCGQGENQAYCYKGACRSHQSQCQKLWGQSGSMADPSCYSKNNVQGIKNGNCGYSLRGDSQRYKACSTYDVECGLLQCWHTATKPQFGTSVTSLPPSFLTVKDKQVICNSVMIDVGPSDLDPGLVPDGARCHTNGMCVDQRCLPVKDFKNTVISRLPHKDCLSGCSGHGRCNSQVLVGTKYVHSSELFNNVCSVAGLKWPPSLPNVMSCQKILGLCHCDAGFAPPLCKEPKPRESQDPGSSKDPRLGSPQKPRQLILQIPKSPGSQNHRLGNLPISKEGNSQGRRPGGSQEPIPGNSWDRKPSDPRYSSPGGSQQPRSKDPRDPGRPESSQEPRPRGSQNPQSLNPRDRRPGGSEEPKPRSPWDHKPSDPRHSSPGGSQEPRSTDPRDSGRPESSQEPRPRGTHNTIPLDPRNRRPGDSQEPKPRSPWDRKPSDPRYSRPGGLQEPRQTDLRDGRPRGSQEPRPRGTQNPKPLDPRDRRPGGSQEPTPRSPWDRKPSDPRYSSPGGSQEPRSTDPRDSGRPGGSQDPRPRVTQNPKPLDPRDRRPGGSQEPKPRSPWDRKPSDPRHSSPGGSQEPRSTHPRDPGRPGGSQVPRPRGSQEPKPGSARDNRPGYTQYHRPGVSQASTPRVPEVPRSGNPWDYRPGDSQDPKLGVSLKPRLGISQEPTSGGSHKPIPRGSQDPRSGGSQDVRPGDTQYNGPDMNYGGQTAIKISLYVIFLCILPILLLILLGWYCWKKHPTTMTCHCCKPLPLPFNTYGQLRQRMRTVINHVKPNQNANVNKSKKRRVKNLTIQHQTIEIVKASNVNEDTSNVDKTNTIRYLTDTSHNGNRIKVDTARIEDTHIYENQSTLSIDKFNTSACTTTSDSVVLSELKKLKVLSNKKTTIEIVEKVEVARPKVKPQITKKPKVISANTTFSANKAPSLPDIKTKTQAQFNIKAGSIKPLRGQTKSNFTIKPNTNTVKKPNLDEKPQLFTDVKLKPVPKSLS